MAYRLDVKIKPDVGDVGDVGEISALTATAAAATASFSVAGGEVNSEVAAGENDSDETILECVLCEQTFQSREDLVQHFMWEELAQFQPEVLFCEHCVDGAIEGASTDQRLTFKSRGDKIDHVLEVHGLLEKLKCSGCSETLWFDSEMDDHLDKGSCGRRFGGRVLHGGSGDTGGFGHVLHGDEQLAPIGML